jgi:hypothetical protein
MTVVDRLDVAGNDRNCAVWKQALDGRRKAQICWTIDVPRWKQALCAALRGWGQRHGGVRRPQPGSSNLSRNASSSPFLAPARPIGTYRCAAPRALRRDRR